ncbi:MAG: hypothetical protein KI793_29715 [Rivularia sp. (in: Bacteria)]|uniref:hypothetical protein n=1 Tax=Rivularia sp. PCC 7116 TaxID=373994 RepID=UPI00029F150B|nr:hypothetical protein [Rivularia sp. PCC 7116]AFY53710.1 hypothetical protein Riv7116_1137 [Rivularia sp. PCC 7116]MBV6627068.1 hypothetical protein [Rivularia sp. MS3]
MEQLKHQVLSLSSKLDDLYQVVEQLDGKVSQALTECNLAAACQGQENHETVGDLGEYQLKDSIAFNSDLEHKDVLVDDVYLDGNFEAGDKHLTPDIQIQRLTAQLTAAYNRIAALEEQLLLKRINS